MFRTVLIANRGAIAVRIVRTLKTMGIRAVAIYAPSDKHSLHVRLADEAYSLGEGAVRETYLNQEKILAIARECGAQAIHPGYGFLSENASFVQSCDAAGVVFLGPTVEQMAAFGLKHTARDLAERCGVPLLKGSSLLKDLNQALSSAQAVGYPVMLKSTAGGGGIGMQRCDDESQLIEAFERVKRLAGNHFADDGVFVEKFISQARHIEVQIFGDGQGKVVAFGERDCSAQRRNQKVIEETPAPNLSEHTRLALQKNAVQLAQAVNYRSAGTVEYVLDADTEQFYFLEVNTRLQVEHGVTEMIYGVDIVRMMVLLGSNELPDLDEVYASLSAQGHSIQVRLYAENPAKDFQPSAGLLSVAQFPETVDGATVRIDRWVDNGTQVSPFYDPMLAKLIVHAPTRDDALRSLAQVLAQTVVYGIQTNLAYLQHLLTLPEVIDGRIITASLSCVVYKEATLDVLAAGALTTIQDAPGRVGYWDVGVPPSGPFDTRAFGLGNRLLNNLESAAGLEITLSGPTVQFNRDCSFVVTGASLPVLLDEVGMPMWQVCHARAGQVLQLGKLSQEGCRAYLLVAGGIDCPLYLGSRSTFTLGQFGGYAGRQLRTGDVLHLAAPALASEQSLPKTLTPSYGREWQIRVVYGPHGSPEFFTDSDITAFFAASWQVHYNSSRTGVRLIGPKPTWARTDGGEAGLHPSNIHDNAYAFGTIDFTGDMPVILGPDGPSLGGFVCPATVIHADLWKIGQLKGGDILRFVAVSVQEADRLALVATTMLQTLAVADSDTAFEATDELISPIVYAMAADDLPDVVYRVAGDRFLLVEYGEMKLDIALRFRVHALMQWLQEHPLTGMLELTPGIRSLQVHFDAIACSRERLVAHLQEAELALGDLSDKVVPSRTVYLPLSWDDQACRDAIDKYSESVRANAPWCPSNIEFIRRINGLDSIDDVKKIVFDARYLVMGLGDVYLGAPVATPIDPRHRLVTTKYNPARTWTAENSVGIGGAYLCVYGMEGPGGYQFIGRTLQMWNRDRSTPEFVQPWLLRFFDQIRFYPVSGDELVRIRAEFPYGQYPLRIEDGTFSLKEYQAFADESQSTINAFETERNSAMDAELARWRAHGQLTFESPESKNTPLVFEDIPEGMHGIDSPVAGSVWRWHVSEGDVIEKNQTIGLLESMKMEFAITSPASGVVESIKCAQGTHIQAGQLLALIKG